MNKNTIVKGAAVAVALVAVGAGSATAASQITASQISTGAVNHRVIADGAVHRTDLSGGVNKALAKAGQPGATGATGPAGADGADSTVPGPQGEVGPAGAEGDSYLDSAYYSVAKYDVGDTNGGAIATVACSDPTDVAISGGVRTIGLGDNGIGNNVPVSSSFPGRMDWTTNTPKPDRLDGWIVQFGTETGNAPKFADVYALCVPGIDVPVTTTFTESGN